MWINVSRGLVVWMTLSEKVYQYDSVLGSIDALGNISSTNLENANKLNET